MYRNSRKSRAPCHTHACIHIGFNGRYTCAWRTSMWNGARLKPSGDAARPTFPFWTAEHLSRIIYRCMCGVGARLKPLGDVARPTMYRPHAAHVWCTYADRKPLAPTATPPDTSVHVGHRSPMPELTSTFTHREKETETPKPTALGTRLKPSGDVARPTTYRPRAASNEW